VLIEDHGMI